MQIPKSEYVDVDRVSRRVEEIHDFLYGGNIDSIPTTDIIGDCLAMDNLIQKLRLYCHDRELAKTQTENRTTEG